ncbi:MAG: 5-formyltetrahydrofolate cyclo-ligase [Microbacteriaceae bacterium]|nr:5-formyltetrahydrofolate cyclo-ligase [Microbacteriaceae bacterium]
MESTVREEKQALRANIRQGRKALTAQQYDAASLGFTENLKELCNSLGVKTISCYLSSATEPNTREFLNWAIAQEITVLLPISREDGLLDWVVANNEGETIGLFGMPEAIGNLLGPIAVNDADLMIIPAASVGKDGMRMGWGKGYFDKTIGSMANKPPIYAVVFENEVFDSVPSNQYDEPISGAVTESKIHRFER